MRISDWSSDVCSSDLEDIHASGDILLQLVDRVLNLTWAEAHSREPDSEALADLSECLETCRRVVEPIARLRGLEMTVTPYPSMPKLRAERLLVKQNPTIGRAPCREIECQYG